MQLDFRGNSFTNIWKEFSDITIGASLDTHGPVAEYLRHGTVWSTIESNLKRLQNEAPHVKFKVTSTVGFLNIESLIEFFEYSVESAEQITVDIHTGGSAVVAVLPYEVAEQKGVEVTMLARAQSYPLQIKLEPETMA
jgi:ATP-dependent Clp protease adapter protein ClpS